MHLMCAWLGMVGVPLVGLVPLVGGGWQGSTSHLTKAPPHTQCGRMLPRIQGIGSHRALQPAM